jgi:hypothetical protein
VKKKLAPSGTNSLFYLIKLQLQLQIQIQIQLQIQIHILYWLATFFDFYLIFFLLFLQLRV